MSGPAPRERPGRDPEAEADRLKARFRAVSRRIESGSGGRGRPRAPGASARPGLGASPTLAIAVLLAVAILLALAS